jgi:hypothetical protein
MCDLGKFVGWQLDSDPDLVAVIDQVNGEPHDLEQSPELLFGRFSEVDRDVGQRVKQGNVVSSGLPGSLSSESRFLLFLQLVVGGA